MASGFKKQKSVPLIQKDKASVNDEAKTANFKVSFQYFDSSQKYASSFRDWQKAGLLSHALDILAGMCQQPLENQFNGEKFTLYGDFPSKDKTKFEIPTHVPEDAHWARIHVNGKSVIVGHIVRDTFYVVFLDKFHSFFLTKRARS
ncbi:MAG: hypothetical protein K2H97_07695 [Prevotella sp.]|nr:hypothetical protein [Prevotella sp.]